MMLTGLKLIYCFCSLLFAHQLCAMEQDQQTRDVDYPEKSIQKIKEGIPFDFSNELINAFEHRYYPVSMYLFRLLKEGKKHHIPWASKPYFRFDIKSHSIMAHPSDQQKIKCGDGSHRTARDMRSTYTTPRKLLSLFNGVGHILTLHSCPPQYELNIDNKE